MLVFLFVASALMLFYVAYLLKSAWYFVRLDSEQKTQPDRPMVTIVVPARNEARFIRQCIEAIFEQDYPSSKWELIVVDDHSEDQTAAIASEYAVKHANIQVLSLENHFGVAYKKTAVAMAIAAAKGDIILCTDADCTMGQSWVSTMVSYFELDTGMVAGPVVLESNSVFGQLQALEFMGLIAVGAAGIAANNPTMCNGANLAYRKAAFEEVGGFAGIDAIASGDDELLMHKIAANPNWRVKFAKSKQAIVHTQAQESWQAFKQQRIRWVSKSTHYERKGITITLVLAYLAMLCFPFLIVLGFWDSLAWWIALMNLIFKLCAEFTILYPAAKFFGKLRLLRWLLPEQFAHIVYILWVGIAGNRKSYEWKGRSVK